MSRKSVNDNSQEYQFREIKGVWTLVHADPIDFSSNAFVLADFLFLNGLVIPDNCQFCRIIEPYRRIEYRAYGGTIRINITYCD